MVFNYTPFQKTASPLAFAASPVIALLSHAGHSIVTVCQWQQRLLAKSLLHAAFVRCVWGDQSHIPHSHWSGVYKKVGSTEEEKGQVELSLDVAPLPELASKTPSNEEIKQ